MVSESHMAELGATLCRYRQENFLCDTLLCANDKDLRAHSVLLAAVSPVFKSAFESSGTAGMYQINLPEIDSTALEIALHYIYTGTLLLPSCYSHSEELPKLFTIMQQLGIEMQHLDGCKMKFKSSENAIETEDQHVGSDQGHDEDERNPEADKLDGKPMEKFSFSSFADEDTHENTNEDTYDLTSYASLRSDDETVYIKSETVMEESLVENSDDTLIIPQNLKQNRKKKLETKFKSEQNVLSDVDTVVSLSPTNGNKMEFVSQKSEEILQDFPDESTTVPQVVWIEVPLAGGITKTFAAQVSGVLPAEENLKKKHACPTCGKEFVCRAILEQHQLVHTGEKPHVCSYCRKAFSMKSNLDRHEKRHTGIRPHLCELCGKGFIQKTALQYHMKIHEDEIVAQVYKQGETYSCSICGLTFNRGANLRKHVQKIHLKNEVQTGKDSSSLPEKKQLLCDLCGKGFASVNSLKLHKMQHTGEKPFVCSICDKAFVVKAQLQYHARLHTGEKPFVCQTCGKGFVGKLGLTQHIRTHTGERPYRCTICGKGFTQSTHLKGHMRSHTGEKPNICHLCGKAYKNRLDLRFHYSRIHEINITKPKPHILKIE